MIIDIGTEVDESVIMWKHKETDEWQKADIDELIDAYESRGQNTRPVGIWQKEPFKNDLWTCSVCGAPLMTDDIEETHFCPNCGAKMYRWSNKINETKNSILL